MPPAHPTRRYLLWLVLLVVALALVAGLALFITPAPTPSSTTTMRTPPPAPQLTPERTINAIGTTQFSALISYTDQGFEPKVATLRNGDTVRFVNNSTGAMSLSLTGAPSDLPPGEYWEMTLETAGDIAFYDTARTEAFGSIRVQ